MILTIRLDDVLRDTLTVSSRDLVTRPTGAAVRSRIQLAIASATAPTTRLDFGAVGLIDFSCADEVVAKLLLDIEGDHYLVLSNLDETQAEAIDHVLERQGLAVAAIPRAGQPYVLGHATPDLIAVFSAILVTGSGDAERLSDHLAWSLERTADALQGLALRRLVVAAAGTFSPLPFQ
jgi:hypothetical protein